jgi:hypothetical protein
MKHVSIADFLTPAEIEQAAALYQKLAGGGRFAATVDAEIIAPNMARINAALGQENDSRYLAYAVEYTFNQLKGGR